MATPGTAITQSDLDDLATLANVKLAPGTPYSLTGNLLADWQRIRDDLLAQVIDTPASPLYRSPDALVSDPQVVGVNPCPLGDGRLYLGDATAAMDADYLPLFKSVEFWFTTYKTHPLKADDPDLTAGDVETYADGTTRPTLMRKLRFNVVTDSLIESDNLLVTWTSTVQSGAPSGTRTIYDAPYTLPFDQAIDAGSDCRAYIELIFPIVWQGDGTAPEPTDSDFTYTCPESEQSILYVEPDGTGWRVRVLSWCNIASGASTLHHSVTCSTWWSPGRTVNTTMPSSGAPGTTWPATPSTARGAQSYSPLTRTTILTIDTASPDPVAVDVIHPAAAGQKITIPDFTGDQTAFKSEGVRGSEFIEVKAPLLRGVWVAKALPTPAMNVFLDQDFYPYIRRVIRSATLAELDTGIFTLSPPIAASDGYMEEPSGTSLVYLNPRTSVRQPAPFLSNMADYEIQGGSGSDLITLAPGATVSGSLDCAWWLHPPQAVAMGTPYEKTIELTESLEIYISGSSGIDVTDAGTYALKVTGLELLTADVESALGELVRKVYYVIRNQTGSPVTFAALKTVYLNPPSIYLPAEPSVENAAATWLVLRDTDPYPNTLKLDLCRSVQEESYTINPGEYASVLMFLELGLNDFRLDNSDDLPVYFAKDYTATIGAYDVMASDGKLTLAALKAFYGDTVLDTFSVAEIYNNTLAPVTITAYQRRIFSTESDQDRAPDPVPVYIPSVYQEDAEEFNYTRTVGEAFSYNITSRGTYQTELKPIPVRGYVIYSVMVRRWPKLTVPATDRHPSIYLPPTAPEDLAALTVKIGQLSGTVHSDFDAVTLGTFQELTEITIPEGELEARVNVFWPVLLGAPLIYQCTESVRVEALVNFQPLFHSNQYSQASGVVDADGNLVRSSIDPSATYFANSLKHRNYRGAWANYPSPTYDAASTYYVHFPPSAAAYNDLIAALNLL